MNNMTLLWSPRSPFARKVVMALDLLQCLHQVELRLTRVAMTTPADPALLAENPLGKIPVLLVPGVGPLFDSRLITSWLDRQHPGVLYPRAPAAHLEAERLEALADGLTDVLLLWRTEESKGQSKDTRITEGFEVKVRAALPELQSHVAQLNSAQPDAGQLALRCCLDQLDFRYPDCAWRTAFPQLAQWHAAIGQHAVVLAHPLPTDLPDHMGVVHMPLKF